MSTSAKDITIDPRLALDSVPEQSKLQSIVDWAHKLSENLVFQLNNGIPKLRFVLLAAPPDKPRDGDFAFADGVNWNPGAGKGLYLFYGGVWNFVSDRPVQAFHYAIGDEVTAITTGTNKLRFRMPYAFTLTSVRCALSVAQASGAQLVTVDIKHNGTTIFSVKPTFDNTELTTQTAVTPSVLSITALADDALMSADVTVQAASAAAGLKIWLIGRRT